MKQEITFGDWLKSRRKSLGITQKSLAERISCSVETIYKIEAGRRRPSVQIAEILRKELGIPARDEDDFIEFARSIEPIDIISRASNQTAWRIRFIPETNLPKPLDSLIGREQVVADAYAMLKQDNVRCITLVGSPGIGKTRIAIKLGETALLDYPDGVYFVKLAAAKNHTQIVSVIAQSLGIDTIGRTNALNNLKQYLFERHTLLIFDNFEQLLDSAHIISAILVSCPLVKIVVTSRSPLRIRGEKQLPVEPLDLPKRSSDLRLHNISGYSAVQLFVERATAVIPTFELTHDNSTAIAAICARLDGVPLAIEIVAARIRLLQPQEILERLNGRLLLASKGIVGSDPRHQSLGAAIAWSVDLLTDTEKNFFYHLGVFADGFTLDAAQVVAEPELYALDLISSLVDMSLLKRDLDRTDDLRFDMLETIREFTLFELDAISQLDAIRQRHADYYYKIALKFEPFLHSGNPVQALSILSADHDNLMTALDYYIDKHDWSHALQLAGALGEYWVYRNHTLLALHYASDLLAKTADKSLETERAKVLNRASMAAYFSGNYRLSTQYARSAKKLALAVHSKENLAFACLAFIMSQEEKWQNDELLSVLEQGLIAATESQETWLIASLLHARGCIARSHGKYDDALTFYAETLALATEVGYEWLIAMSLWNIGTIEQAKKYHSSALQKFQQSLEVSIGLGDVRGIVLTLWRIADIWIAKDQVASAIQLISTIQSLHSRRNTLPEGQVISHFEDFLNSARVNLGRASFDKHWELGQLLTSSQIMELVRDNI